MRAAVFALVSILTIPTLAEQNPSNITGAVQVYVRGYNALSDGWAQNFNTSILRLGRCNLTGTHDIRSSAQGVVASVELSSDQYEGTVQAAALAGHCYRAFIDAGCACSDDSNSFQSAQECTARQTTDLDPTDCTDPCTSPIVINLDAGPYVLSGIDDPVEFDIDGNGAPDRITWTARGSATAFLALDRNGNGDVDSGAELFGTATPLASGARARNGFEALRELDSNADGVVSGLDERWGDLLLWTDSNHDGRSHPRELQRMAAATVDALETSYHWTGRTDPHGNAFRYQSLASVSRRLRPFYDVYFRVAP